MIKNNNILTFKNLSQIPGLVHGFSTRPFGSMRPSNENYEASLASFLKALHIDSKHLVRMKQIHSSTVTWVDSSHCETVIPENDGLLTEKKQVFLSVITGDCLPLLFYDKEKKYIAAVHAGWKGIYNEIIKETIQAMVIKGSNPEDIIVGIGPSIRACCYEFGKDDLQKFLDKFPKWTDYAIARNGKNYLDTQCLAKHQLEELGVPKENIEDGDYCTFDKNNDVYSYRKEGKTFGEFIGVIGRIA